MTLGLGVPPFQVNVVPQSNEGATLIRPLLIKGHGVCTPARDPSLF